LVFALINGGPRALFFGMIIAVIGALAQAACLGEMASMIPVAGAQYHWTWHMAPKRMRMFATWVQGWTTWFGYVALQAALANILVVQLESLIALNSTTYIAGGWKTSVLVIGCAVIQGLVNVYAFRVIPWLEMISSILHVGLFVLVLVVFVVMAPRHDASFLLRSIIASGWDHNSYVSWHLGMLTCIFSITGIVCSHMKFKVSRYTNLWVPFVYLGVDGVIHMSEETRQAKSAVPRAMVWSIAINGSLAVIMAAVILIYMGDIEVALGSPNPFATIMLNITRSRAATTTIISGFVLLGFNSSLTAISSVSRLTWAWSRDGGLPAYFTYLDPTHRIPVRSVWLGVVSISLICLLNIASEGTIAFNAITSLSSFVFFFSYSVATACLLYARLAGNITMGEWNLGKWGIPVNLYALIYSLYIMVFLPFPSVLPVTANSMNYTGPVFGLVLFVVIVWWFLHGKSHWRGPNLTIMEYVMTHS
jgi:choline transport protein